MLKSSPTRQIVHVDMDAFYASVEQRDDPSLRGRPLIVEARAGGGGVHSVVRGPAVRGPLRDADGGGAPTVPEAAVVAPRMSHYAQISEEVMGILGRFTPLVEALSLDEAFLDVTASRSLATPARRSEIAPRSRCGSARDLLAVPRGERLAVTSRNASSSDSASTRE